MCKDQPFFSTDDWFIGATTMPAGVPGAWRPFTVGFPYGDLDALEARSAPSRRHRLRHPRAGHRRQPGPASCRASAPCATRTARARVRRDDHRLPLARARRRALYGVRPDLSTFGKALGNGFSDVRPERSPRPHGAGRARPRRERVFLLSTTHGAETHGLAVAVRSCAATARRASPSGSTNGASGWPLG